MRVQITGRQIDLGEALKGKITDELTQGITKYFSSRPADAVVTVARHGAFFAVDCSVHLDSGMRLHAEGQGGDAHAAFADALDKIEKRVRRYKRKLKSHNTYQKSSLPAETATAYVLAPTPEDGSEDALEHESAEAGPLVIAETKVKIPTMPVSMAVLQLGLAEGPALLFRNAAHGGLNLVYRRADGNIGWVDPERLNASAA
ncbi:MAG: ribosome hibernation-promoting factor, HPF/YfiA family [Caulobacterales bacterium]|jgi:ribosomal subunit interface protein